jgi:hypothetical protein
MRPTETRDNRTDNHPAERHGMFLELRRGLLAIVM